MPTYVVGKYLIKGVYVDVRRKYGKHGKHGNVANMPHMENMPYMTSPYGYEPCGYGIATQLPSSWSWN